MKVEIVPFGGWEMCLRLANAGVEVITTAQVGPRIVRFGSIDGPNEFAGYPEQAGKIGGNEWRSYGGHRLWHAPEVRGRTNTPDNHPVSWWPDGDWLHVQAPPETGTGIQKEMSIWLDPDRDHVRIVHKLTNLGPWAVQFAPWAITVMDKGGRAIVPQEPFRSHSDHLLPVRSVSLWGYTDMSDPRFTWGRRYVQLRQDAAAAASQKFGVSCSQGWACHLNGGRAFIKRFPYDPKAVYPDLGCNLECYTNQRMLEVESLGPLSVLEPGSSVCHEEGWFLFRGAELNERAGDDEIDAMIQPLLDRTG